MPNDFSENMPVFILGDLNSKPTSSVVQLFTGRGLQYSLVEDLDPPIMELCRNKKSRNKRNNKIVET